MKFLGQERNTLSTKRRRLFIFISLIIMIAAMLVSCDKLEPNQNTNAATDSASGTQTWAAYALETITPTRLPSTNTPTPSSAPTETPTITPTQTPSPTPTPEIPYLIAQFGLNPDRQYTIVETENGVRYLRDDYNQALMLRHVVVEEAGQLTGEWVDTSLEEKYGHLVPVGETLHVYSEIGYQDIDGVESTNDTRYQNLIIVARNTGNIYTQTVFDPDLGQEVTRLIGQAVYRDRQGNLQSLNLVYNTVATSSPIFLPRVCVYRPPDTLESLLENEFRRFCPEQGALGITPNQALDPRLMGTPGQPFRVRVTYNRPNLPPDPFVNEGTYYSNINSQATWYLWHQYAQAWAEMATSILDTGINPYPDIPLGVTWADLYMSSSDLDTLTPLFPCSP